MDRSLIRNIAAISLPAIVINITAPILAIADIAIAGHLGSAVFIAAIAVGSTLFNMLYWLLGFLRMSTTGLAAQALGASDSREIMLIPARALMIAGAAGFAFIALQDIIGPALLRFLEADAVTTRYAIRYFRICIWGAPAMLGTFVLTGWFIGMQDSRTPMWISIFIDIFNIALSLTLVLALRMGTDGIAAGTLCAQWAGFIVSAILFLKHSSRYRARTDSKALFNTHKLKRLLSVNTDIFLRTLCLVAVTLWFTRSGAAQGAGMLAVNALLMQMFTLFSFFTDGLVFSAEALCGKFLGAADQSGIRNTVRTLMMIAFFISVAFSTVYLIFGNDLLKLLSDDANVIGMAGKYLYWAVAIPLAGFAAFVWDGVCIGLTHTKSMLLSMAVAMVLFFACYILAFPPLHNHGLWLAFIIYLMTRGITLTVICRRYL